MSTSRKGSDVDSLALPVGFQISLQKDRRYNFSNQTEDVNNCSHYTSYYRSRSSLEGKAKKVQLKFPRLVYQCRLESTTRDFKSYEDCNSAIWRSSWF
jgi:hypothetical protein